MTPFTRNQSLLEWPTVQLAGRKILRLIGLASCGDNEPSVSRETPPIILLQWLVAVATSYLVLTTQDWNFSDPLSALLVLTCLISAVVLQRLPKNLIERHSTRVALLLLDTALIVVAITSPQQIPWDLLLLFFFCLFMATMGESLVQIGIGCVLLSVTFLVFVPSQAMDLVTVNPSFLIRVPFMFGISIFYGYLSNELKREKKRSQGLEASMRLKRQVVAGVAHDMKTPLNVIMGHVELLGEDIDSKATGRLASIKCIRRNIDDIIKLLSDFLLISKVEARQPDSEKNLIQLNRIAEDVVGEQMVVAREKNIAVSLDLEKALKPIIGDEGNIHRALSNLVNNAIKYSQAGGSVTVVSRHGKSGVSLQVKDNGPGIAKEDQSSLFSEYKRLKSAENTIGTGLGLFIVKTIVEAHGGVVQVESNVGHGTTFTINIPTDP